MIEAYSDWVMMNSLLFLEPADIQIGDDGGAFRVVSVQDLDEVVRTDEPVEGDHPVLFVDAA